MKLLKWEIQNGSYFADICTIGDETIQFEIIPYTDGTFGLFIANSFHSAPRRLATAQNKAQKFYNQFLESC
jgi:hypothetical protein